MPLFKYIGKDKILLDVYETGYVTSFRRSFRGMLGREALVNENIEKSEVHL